jgi:hypothetical protein
MFTFIVNIFLNFFLHMSQKCSTFAVNLKKTEFSDFCH